MNVQETRLHQDPKIFGGLVSMSRYRPLHRELRMLADLRPLGHTYMRDTHVEDTNQASHAEGIWLP
jgi:hypothetical protein